MQPVPERPQSEVPGRLNQLSLRPLTRCDLSGEQIPVAAEVIEARLRQQAVCLGAFRRDELVGYLWYSPRQYLEDEVLCRYALEPAAASVFDFDLYILPKYRMGRAFTGIWYSANEHLRERGVRYTFSRISKFNTASLRAHAHLGCRRIATALFLRAWSLQLMLSGMRPYVHLSFGSARPVELRLAASAALVVSRP
ncbi:MAG: N-acetyltransferase family protein [Steroidobacteraceae bacterium]